VNEKAIKGFKDSNERRGIKNPWTLESWNPIPEVIADC
jgi:hypothetical protein